MFAIFDKSADEAIAKAVEEAMVRGDRVLDEEVTPYLVHDALGRNFWFSPVSGEAVVIQIREGRC